MNNNNNNLYSEQARKDRAKSKDKKRDSDLRRNLANIRVVQRNLDYITNLALASAKEDVSIS